MASVCVQEERERERSTLVSIFLVNSLKACMQRQKEEADQPQAQRK